MSQTYRIKRSRRGDVDESTWMFIGVVVLIIGICALAYAGRDRLTSGTITAKRHYNPSSSIGVATVFGGGKDGPSFVVTNDAVPEKWTVLVRGEYEGETRVEERQVDRYFWESCKVGDYWREGN